jgi:hypothetical protein
MHDLPDFRSRYKPLRLLGTHEADNTVLGEEEA